MFTSSLGPMSRTSDSQRYVAADRKATEPRLHAGDFLARRV
jgi:hypothetical protein